MRSPELRPLTPAGEAIAIALLPIEEWPGLTLNECVERCDLHRSAAGVALVQAEERGWVRSRFGTWRLTPAGRAGAVALRDTAAEAETSAG